MDTSTALAIFVSCVQSMVQLTLITISGAVLTHWKIFTEHTNEAVAMACANFFFPMFIFVNLGQSLSLSKLEEQWPLFFSPFVIIPLASLVGLAHMGIFRPPKKLRWCMLCMMCLNNSGNVPLLILAGACKPYGPLGGDINCKDAQGYVVLQVFNFNLLCWTYGIFLFQLDQNYQSVALIEVDSTKPPAPSRLSILAKNLIGPVPLGSYLGLIAGITPGMHWLAFDSDAPLRPVADAMALLGMVGIVLSQMILGSNLILTYGRQSTLSSSFTLSSLFTRLLIIPAIGLGITKLTVLSGIMGNNKAMLYVLFLGFASPSAVSVLVLAQITNVGINELTKLMFMQYVVAVVTLTLSCYAFFIIFE